MKPEYIDYLTKIHNEAYLKKYYLKYLKKNEIHTFIMLDFEAFKSINDTFGHNIGDLYLQEFARIMTKYFEDSIVARLHGDEFAIVTKYPEDKIMDIFELCDKEIREITEMKKIPSVFFYNAGSTDAKPDLDSTKEEADYMMYYAKKHKIRYQKFSDKIWQTRQNDDLFLKRTEQFIEDNSFTYAERSLYNCNKKKQEIIQIYTRTERGRSLFKRNKYSLLKKYNLLAKIDLQTLKNMISIEEETNQKRIITVDYNSLIKNNDIYEYIEQAKEEKNNNLKNLIISVDISDIEKKNYPKLIKTLNLLKKMNLGICIDKYDSTTGDLIFEKCDLSYVKISSDYWKKAMNNNKVKCVLSNKIKMMNDLSKDLIPIFDMIETKQEFDFIKGITKQNALFSGNYFSEETQMDL